MNPLKRTLLIVAGSIALCFAIAGIVLPLLPATPFLLLSAACYVRSSDRLHAWLMRNRFFGPYIRNFKEGRGMPLRAKVITLVILWASLAVSIVRVEIVLLEVALILSGFIATFFIYRIRTAPASID